MSELDDFFGLLNQPFVAGTYAPEPVARQGCSDVLSHNVGPTRIGRCPLSRPSDWAAGDRVGSGPDAPCERGYALIGYQASDFDHYRVPARFRSIWSGVSWNPAMI